MAASGEFFEGVRALLGDRLAMCRLEDGRWMYVTVIDLDEDDSGEIRRLAAELGVAPHVRIERAAPEHLVAWEQLRHDLHALQDSPRRVLQMCPTPEPGYQRPPVHIVLAATAEDVAADLHARYGDFVSLVVGAQRYPPDPSAAFTPRERAAREPVDPDELLLDTDGLVVTASGETRGFLSVTNLSDVRVEVHTNGTVYAEVADPEDGRIVGVTSGMRTSALVRIAIDAGDTVRVPVRVGTDCLDPTLGYLVPAGRWQMIVPLELGDGRLLEARLPLIIEPAG